MKLYSYHTLVLGSGAAGLAAAVRLRAEGVENVALLTEGLEQGTSINTGSDKQTYYKPSLCGATPDSPRAVAESYLVAGGADGDLALTEAATATRAFFHLVDLGVPFPRDSFGQYCGYRTDHDPARRATSCGPYTSREMCRALIREVKRRDVPILEDRVAVRLLAIPVDGEEAEVPRRKLLGVVCVNCATREFEVYRAQNVVFAVGGPGGLYKRSVYPEVHTGAIGLALEIGALANGLPESQFGLASFTNLEGRRLSSGRTGATPKEFRWNVSGSFMQVVPKFVSTEQDGTTRPREFLKDYFKTPAEAHGLVFLKGYQWPFDARKALGGSSLIDLCVFYETTILGRRVFLDYRANPEGYAFSALPSEAREYLANSGAELATPIERLERLNPDAIALYRDWGVDLATEPLEIGVCAQHNNGGLAVDRWWRSVNVEGLYPIGEVAGTHGVARPGGSALNAGQVGAFRAAERIGRDALGASASPELESAFVSMAVEEVAELRREATYAREHGYDWRVERDAFQRRMSDSGGFLRDEKRLARARTEAVEQLARLYSGKRAADRRDQSADAPVDADDVETMRNLQLCLAHKVYLDAIFDSVTAGVGSRGSQLALDPGGTTISDRFPSDWRAQEENVAFRSRVFCSYLTSKPGVDDSFATRSFWRDARPIPEPDEWFENVWRDYREGKIYD